MPLSSCLDFGFLHGIPLNQLFQSLGIPPTSFVVVKGRLGSLHFENNWILPVAKLNSPSNFRRVVKLVSALDRWFQLQVIAGLSQRVNVADLCLHFYDVRDLSFSSWLKLSKRFAFRLRLIAGIYLFNRRQVWSSNQTRFCRYKLVDQDGINFLLLH